MMEQTVCRFRFAETVCVGNILEKQDITDEQIRQQCQAREDYEYWERMRENKYKQALAEKDRQLIEKDQELAKLNARIAELESKDK